MENYFANFIKTGNPNVTTLPEWPAAAPNNPEPAIMWIKTGSKAIKAIKNDNRFLLLGKIYDKQ
jgi:para-nitrobenzyl esterase